MSRGWDDGEAVISELGLQKLGFLEKWKEIERDGERVERNKDGRLGRDLDPLLPFLFSHLFIS